MRLVAVACLIATMSSCVGSAPRRDATDGSPGRARVSQPSTTSAAHELSDEELIAAAKRGMARIRSTGCGSVSVGSAWAIGPNRLVTNRHVVEGAEEIEALSWDGHDISVGAASVSASADLATVLVGGDNASQLVPLTVRSEPVAAGERLAIVGFPEGGELQVSTGVVVDQSAAEPGDASSTVIRSTAVIHHGNSGGPVLDMKGRVVGVAYADEVKTDLALIVPAADVVALDHESLTPTIGACRAWKS